MIRPRHAMLSTLLVALNLSIEALGQASAKSDGRTLMEEARKARTAGDHARALSLASRAGRAQMTPSIRLFIAEEQSALGEIAESMNNAELCAREAAAASALPDRESVVRSCRALLSKLQQSAARLIINVTDPMPPQIEVTVNGEVLAPSLFGQPYFLKPGAVRVEAKAPAHRPFRSELGIPAGEERTVIVSLDRDFGPEERLEAQPREEPRPTVVAAPSSSKSSIGPYVVLGAGALSFGASAIFLVLRNRAIDDLEKQCGGPNRSICPATPGTRSLQSKISRDNTLANVALSVGGAAVLGGALWLVLDKTAMAHSVQLQLEPREGGAVAGVAGAF